MRQPLTTPQAVTFALSACRELTIERLIQRLIDETPAAYREVLAYAIFYAYLTIRLPDVTLAPDPSKLATLRPGQKRYILLNDAALIFDFSSPTLRPRGVLANVLRSRRVLIHVFTPPHLVASWMSRINAWPTKYRKRIDVRTVPDWLSTGISLMTLGDPHARRTCLQSLTEPANQCLRTFPRIPLQIQDDLAEPAIP